MQLKDPLVTLDSAFRQSLAMRRGSTEESYGETVKAGVFFTALAGTLIGSWAISLAPDIVRVILGPNWGQSVLPLEILLMALPARAVLTVRVELKGVESKGEGRWLVRLANSAFTVAEPQRPVLVADSLAMVVA